MVYIYSGLGFIVFWLVLAVALLFVLLKVIAPVIRMIRGKFDPFWGFSWNIITAYLAIKRSRNYLSRAMKEASNEKFKAWVDDLDTALWEKEKDLKHNIKMTRVKKVRELEETFIEENESGRNSHRA